MITTDMELNGEREEAVMCATLRIRREVVNVIVPQGGPVIRPGVADRKPFVGEDADSPVIVEGG